MNLAEYDQWSQGEEAVIGFLRHAEIKHGRVAMFGFVGYIVQANGIHWPWNLERSGLSFGDISAAGSPPDQWDALPTAAKMQIILATGFYPSFKTEAIPHPVPFDLFDPFGISKNATPE